MALAPRLHAPCLLKKPGRRRVACTTARYEYLAICQPSCCMSASFDCHLVSNDREDTGGRIVQLGRIKGDAAPIVPSCNQHLATAEQCCRMKNTPNAHLSSLNKLSCGRFVKFARRKTAYMRTPLRAPCGA